MCMLFGMSASCFGPGWWIETDRCTHGYAHTQECRMLDSLSGPGEPLTRALTGCGIDRPSVTVSRWIKESERETQRREEARKEKEKRREEGSNLVLLQEVFSVFLSETAPYPTKKDLILPPKAAAAPLKLTISLFCSRSLARLSLSPSLCLLRDSSVSAVGLCAAPGNLPKRLNSTT